MQTDCWIRDVQQALGSDRVLTVIVQRDAPNGLEHVAVQPADKDTSLQRENP